MVDTLADTADANPGNGIAADANGKTSLRAAIEESNARGKGDVNITFDPAIADKDGKITIHLGKTLSILDQVTINGDIGTSHFVKITSDSGFSQITNWAYDVQITAMQFHGGNYSTGSGAAIRNMQEIVVNNCNFTNCYADTGGAIYNSGVATIGDSFFTNNSSANWGGAVFSGIGNTLSVYFSSFKSNLAENGGGIASLSSGTVIYYGYFDTNSASKTGGGVYLSSSISSYVESSTFLQNTAIKDGGGMFVAGSTIQIYDTKYEGNVVTVHSPSD